MRACLRAGFLPNRWPLFITGVSRPGLLEQRVRGNPAPRPTEDQPVQGQLRPVQGDGGAKEETAGCTVGRGVS